MSNRSNNRSNKRSEKSIISVFYDKKRKKEGKKEAVECRIFTLSLFCPYVVRERIIQNLAILFAPRNTPR